MIYFMVGIDIIFNINVMSAENASERVGEVPVSSLRAKALDEEVVTAVATVRGDVPVLFKKAFNSELESEDLGAEAGATEGMVS